MTAQDADEGDSEPAEADESARAETPTAAAVLSVLAETPDDLAAVLTERLTDGSGNAGDDADGEVADTVEAAVAELEEGDDALDEFEDVTKTQLVRAAVALWSVADGLENELRETREHADELESRLARKQAEFQNYKRRQQSRLDEEKQRATEALVERLLDVRDNLDRALEQDDDADIRGGVESTLEQFDHQLERESVTPIEPDEGDETDPRRHEVLVTIASAEPEGTVAQIHRPGYEMAGKVLRPAQVAVSDGSLVDDAVDAEGDQTEPGSDDTTAEGETDGSKGGEAGDS